MYYLLSTIPKFGQYLRYLNLSALLLALSCSFGVDGDIETKSQSYNLNFQSSLWKKIPSGAADHAFQSSRSNSIILLNSLCHKYESTSLHHLITNMLGGLDEIKVLKEQTMSHSKRESLRRFVTGKTDGVPVYLVIQTLKKDGCIYDFVLISANQDLQRDDLQDFDQFMSETTIN